MVIALRIVYVVAAVLAHPSLEPTSRVLYDRDSGCHEILQDQFCRVREQAQRLRGTTHVCAPVILRGVVVHEAYDNAIEGSRLAAERRGVSGPVGVVVRIPLGDLASLRGE